MIKKSPEIDAKEDYETTVQYSCPHPLILLRLLSECQILMMFVNSFIFTCVPYNAPVMLPFYKTSWSE